MRRRLPPLSKWCTHLMTWRNNVVQKWKDMGTIQYILGIETSCDETAAAIVQLDGMVLSNVVSTQVPVHARYGGVVPELASRNHLLAMIPVIDAALEAAKLSLEQIDAIAVTQGPGLIGSLLVGLQTAKTLAMTLKVPLLGVDHVEAHITAAMLAPPEGSEDGDALEPPYVAMVASGGHEVGSYHVLGHTVDDAAGEAFDKSAKMMGLPYPGGVAIQNAGESGNPNAIAFPRAMMKPGNMNFSFSGLKTAVRNYLQSEGVSTRDDPRIPDIAASVQEAIVDVLLEKSIRAIRTTPYQTLVLAGGVAANKRLREKAAERCAKERYRLVRTPMPYCTDNAAMVAGLGALLLRKGGNDATGVDLSMDAYANLKVGSPRSHRTRES
jgi:N6-L-threonylcarbamoyladenine synthase